MTPRWVYRIDQVTEAEEAVGGDWDAVRGLLGGKGANLGDMARLGVPVPPGFIVTTEVCHAYLARSGQMPEGLMDQIEAALAWMEEETGRSLGDPRHPLLVSCRSGAKFSMPGMMDTVLNIGLDEEVVAGLATESGDRFFALDTYRRLVQMFGSVVLGHKDELFEQVLTELRARRGVESDSQLTTADLEEAITRFRRIAPGFPDDPREQLHLAVEAVFRSWNGKRAVDYRNASGIPHDLGTAVIPSSEPYHYPTAFFTGFSGKGASLHQERSGVFQPGRVVVGRHLISFERKSNFFFTVSLRDTTGPGVGIC